MITASIWVFGISAILSTSFEPAWSGGDRAALANRKVIRIAILIPAYNCARTVTQTVDSLQQIEHGWENVDRLLICDDASSDATWELLQGARFDRCPLVLLRHSSNRGEAACYDTMLAMLPETVRWFLILHADDLALPNFILRNCEILLRCDERVAAVSSTYYVFGSGSEWLTHSPPEDIIQFRSGNEDLVHTALVGCWWHISGSLINRGLWESFGGRRTDFPQVGDWDLLLRWQSAGYVVGHSLVPTTKYRVSVEGSLSSRAWVQFRDIQERTNVIAGLPAVFSPKLKRKLVMQISAAALRRVCRLAVAGRWPDAANGARISLACISSLVSRAPASLRRARPECRD